MHDWRKEREFAAYDAECRRRAAEQEQRLRGKSPTEIVGLTLNNILVAIDDMRVGLQRIKCRDARLLEKHMSLIGGNVVTAVATFLHDQRLTDGKDPNNAA